MAVKKIKKPKLPKVSEKKFQASLIKALKYRGVYVYRQNVIKGEFNGRFLSSGIPLGSSDLVAIFKPHGIVVFIECKSTTGKLMDTQVIFSKDLEKVGANYYVASPRISLQDTLNELFALVEDKCQKITKACNQESLSSKTDMSKHTLTLKLT